MKVLFDHQVFSYQSQGGVSRYFSEIVHGLELAGHEADRGWRWSPNRYLPGPDLLGNLRFKGKAALRALGNHRVSVRKLAGAWDVFHPTYYDPYFLTLLQGRPFVLTIHDMTHELFPGDLVDSDVVPSRKKLLANRAAQVIAVSESTKADAVRLLGLDPSRVTVIAHGNSLRPGIISVTPSASPGPYWLYVGARKTYKDFLVLVAALGLREASRRGDRLVMVGGGPVTRDEAAALAAAGLNGRWLQTDCSESELAGWYQDALALVYPSRYEGFGLPLVEAMAWGCPVVSSRASCLPEVAGEAALYFTPGAADELVTCLERVTIPRERHRLVAAGRVRETSFTWESAVNQTLGVYRKAMV